MKFHNENKPCIYAELKQCGKKFDFYDYSENLSLTKKSRFEILVSRKLTEERIDKKYHPLIINSIEVLLPVVVLLIAGLLLAPRD